jgi:DNA uptake protein ComE-like DNA-binding protein
MNHPLSRLVLTTAAVLTMLAPNAARAQVGKSLGVAYPNLAGAEELRALPHVTPTLADAILERRPFLSMLDLDRFLTGHGLSRSQLGELYGRMFVPINLNTATREEILLVPGVGNRMAHEFEEYRPYRALAQFRREIGKYVDDAEVARLEQYVFVPIDLNTASDEAILSIPGVGPRMLREFKEYRPYTSMVQFRREIGKYVSEKEVARLERYVTINP